VTRRALFNDWSFLERCLVTLQILNVSEMKPPWNWLERRFLCEQLSWKYCSSYRRDGGLPKIGMMVSRVRAALEARSLIGRHSGQSVIVSHGPRAALYSELIARGSRNRAAHLVFSFNFTDLPAGARRSLIRRCLRRADRFVVASIAERDLYSKYFEIEDSRIDFLPWSIRPPLEELARPARYSDGQYICAIGSQARDYETLLEAMRRIPAIRLILVGSPDSIPDLPIPGNVKVVTNVPLSDAMNILAHSRFMVLPLRNSTVPCGHVTVVSAMHMGKAILATDSSGLSDYLIHGRNAELVAPKDSKLLSVAIDRLFNDSALCERLGNEASIFARQNCTEDRAVEYFQAYLRSIGYTISAS
jgi:glycosyltransferase involved in cell wall biosynthesis